jgi:DHA1 family bicyclomycin/chloramphenicol resistance-like MFS transporter
MLGFLQMGIGTLASVAVSVFNNGTSTPMVVVIAVTSVLAMGVLVAGRRLGRLDRVDGMSGQGALPH